MKHLISARDLNIDKINDLFLKADTIRLKKQTFQNVLSEKIIATIFYEPSTRTRLSFESAALRLGAKIISTENAFENSSGKKGETIEDTIKVVQNYSDLIIIRHPADDCATRAASVSNIPIINAGAGTKEHPTQALLDLYTLYVKKGKIDGLSIAFLGDLFYGRTSHSLIKLLSMYNNISIYELSSEKTSLPNEYTTLMKENNIEYKKLNSLSQLPVDLDVLYQTRLQTERISKNLNVFNSFDLNKNVMNFFSKDTLIMHPLPRMNELSTDLDNDPRAIYFEQVKNGLFIRMAILLDLLV